MRSKNNIASQEIDLGGQKITLEIGRYAAQASAAVLGRLGDTVVLATVVVGKEDAKFDYLPLFVEYQERFYSGGKIKGSRWVKREGRPSDDAILAARMIDRSVRPLFPKTWRKEIQVVVTTLSVDGENDPGVAAVAAVSAALSMTELPFAGPAGAVRIGFIPKNGEGSFLTNPTYKDREYSDLDLVVAGNRDGIIMVEAGAGQVSEKVVLQALKYGHDRILELISGIEALLEKAGVDKKRPENGSRKTEADDLAAKIVKVYRRELEDLIKAMAAKEGGAGLAELAGLIGEKEVIEDDQVVKAAIDDAVGAVIRENILKKGVRPDGRKAGEIRPIVSRVGELPRTHGSAMFQRGDTQALTIATLASPSMEQWIESPEYENKKRYMHHYNMPPYSVGETGRMGWPSRREIGHGSLAERALEPLIPAESEFPYTIRIVSEIMSSNGSTSMASVCGSTLSLMDAGVPIKAPVSGIAMGLVMEKGKAGRAGNYVILSDIAGIEDFKGDMDFKVAGTKSGITALQMDVKVPGVSMAVLEEALEQARLGRLEIMEKMLKALPEARPQISQYAPKIEIIKIDPGKIGGIIGPGGKTIKKIIAETGADIDVEDDGTVTIAGMDKDNIARAVDWIKGLTQEVEEGQEYEGEVVRVTDFGVFVNLIPGKDGLVHVSKLTSGYVGHPADVISEGEKMKVIVERIDDQGRVSLVPAVPLPVPEGARPRADNRGGGNWRRPDKDNRRFDGGQRRKRTVRRPYYER